MEELDAWDEPNLRVAAAALETDSPDAHAFVFAAHASRFRPAHPSAVGALLHARR